MPHYSDGTEAQVGDVVRGKGYNIKGPDGQPCELVGTVVGLTPGSDSCNIQLVVLQLKLLPKEIDLGAGWLAEGRYVMRAFDQRSGQATLARAQLEYGACRDFTLVLRQEA